MNFAHSSRSTALKSMLRCCTLARRWTFAGVFDVGLASIDWQMLAAPQVSCAAMLPFRTFHRLKMFGIDDTEMRASGRPALSTLRPAMYCARKFATLVMLASELLQTSLAPRSTRTWSGLFGALTALVAWLTMFDIVAPVTASLPPTVWLVCGRASTTDGFSALTRLK